MFVFLPRGGTPTPFRARAVAQGPLQGVESRPGRRRAARRGRCGEHGTRKAAPVVDALRVLPLVLAMLRVERAELQ